MDKKELTSKVQELIFNNNLKSVFKLLKEELDNESERYLLFLTIGGRYNSIADQEMADTIKADEVRLEKNKIGRDILSFVKTLEQADLGSKTGFSNKEIPNKILVFTQADDVEKMEVFFRQLNFVNVVVNNHEEDFDAEAFDLFIFDNQDLPVCFSKKNFEALEGSQYSLVKNRIDKMESIIRSSSKFLIHFGNILFWINQNRNRVQAANSKFSLHARTKEVIDFINTYRV